MTYREIVETRGNFRAVIHIDEMPSQPDGDFFGTVYYGDRGRFTRQAAPYKSPDDFSDTLDMAWERYQDMELVERYLRICHGVRGFDYFDTQEGKYVNVVTDYDLTMWGWDLDPEGWPVVDGVRLTDPAANNLDEWKAYAEGDVWYRTVEKRVTWHTDDADFEDREEWEAIDDSALHGLYGQEWAEESAREGLAEYTEDGE